MTSPTNYPFFFQASTTIYGSGKREQETSPWLWRRISINEATWRGYGVHGWIYLMVVVGVRCWDNIEYNKYVNRRHTLFLKHHSLLHYELILYLMHTHRNFVHRKCSLYKRYCYIVTLYTLRVISLMYSRIFSAELYFFFSSRGDFFPFRCPLSGVVKLPRPVMVQRVKDSV